MKVGFSLIAAMAWAIAAQAQSPQSFPLWASSAPGALGTADKDIPTLTPYLPDATKATGAAIVICPGGGYGMLASHEGADYARFLNEFGVAGFVLKYRLGSSGYHHPVMLQDESPASRTSRARAAAWKCEAKRCRVRGA